MLSEKYMPQKIEEFGDKGTVEFIKKWDRKKPILISGGIGVGKTALINAISKEYNFEITRVENENISNFKNIVSTSGFYGTKLVVVEDADTIRDIKKISEGLSEAKNPVILTTNDPKSKKLAGIKKICREVEIRKPLPATIANILEKICKKEGVSAEKSILQEIAKKCGGDIRAAINDLETIIKGRKELKGEVIIESRDSAIDIFKAVGKIFKAKNLSESLEAYYSIDEKPDFTLMWIDENMPKEYQSEDISRAIYFISRADIFLERITSRQYWGFLRYVNYFIAGVAIAKSSMNYRYTPYSFPSYIIKLSRIKKEKETKHEIGRKISPILHVSSKKAALEYIPLLKILSEKKKISEKDMELFKFSGEELEYIGL